LQINTYLDCGPPEELVKLLAIFMIRTYFSAYNKHCPYRSFSVILININSLSVSIANRANIVFVICKVLTILTIIIAGLVRIGQGLFLFWLKSK
jgi:amino acid permease